MTSTMKRTLALFAAIIISAALCPALAHAAQLNAGTDAAADNPKMVVQTQATKNVYMLTKVTKTSELADGSTVKAERRFAYNKNKLLKSVNGWVLKWSYGKNNGVKSIKRGDGEYTISYTLNAKGRQTECDIQTDDSITTLKPKYNKSGKLVSVASHGFEYEDDSSYDSKTSYSYKNGLRVKRGDTSYEYDKRKNLLKEIGYYSSVTFKNTYKNGRLVKRTFAYGEEGDVTVNTFTYTYKRMKVQKNLVKKVKAQQWALKNNNLNDALGFGMTFNSIVDDDFWY